MDNSPIREAKRQWLNTVVKDLGVSQREVADRLELPYANFNAMLNGHRAVSDDTVDLVHQRLGVALPLSGYSLSGQRSLTMPIAFAGMTAGLYIGFNLSSGIELKKAGRAMRSPR